MHVKALGRRISRQRRDSALLAYNIGAFVGFSKLPPWEQIERKLDPTPRKPMTDEQIMHVMDLHIAGMRAQGLQPAA